MPTWQVPDLREGVINIPGGVGVYQFGAIRAPDAAPPPPKKIVTQCTPQHHQIDFTGEIFKRKIFWPPLQNKSKILGVPSKKKHSIFTDIIQIEVDPPPYHPIFDKFIFDKVLIMFWQKLLNSRLWIYILYYPYYFLRVRGTDRKTQSPLVGPD